MTSIQPVNNESDTLIEMARAKAIEVIGEPLPEATQDEREAWFATIETHTAINLGRMGNTVKLALRQQIFEMAESGRWSLVPIPIQNESGEYTGKNRFFDRFEEWFDFVVERSGIDDSHKSALTTGIKVIQPLALSGQITTSAGVTITTQDVLSIEPSKLEVSAGAIRKLDEAHKAGDPKALSKMGDVIVASQTLTKNELKEKLTDMGLLGRRVTPVTAMEVNSGSYSYLLICPKSAAEMQRIRMLLGNSVEVGFASVQDVIKELDYEG